MERHTHRLSLVCYLGVKNFGSMSKQDRHLVVGFIGGVLAFVGEDVSGDVDRVNPTQQFDEIEEICEGGTELIFLRGCCSYSRVIHWEPQGKRSMVGLSTIKKLSFIADLS